MNRPFPVRPQGDDLLETWQKYVAIQTVATLRNRYISTAASEMFGKLEGDRIVKAATEPATTTGWGAPLARTRVGALLRSLRGRSAAAQLFDRIEQYNLADGANSITLPGLSADMSASAFVDESGAIPVLRASFDTTLLGPPKKLAALSAVTHELASLAVENAVQLVGELLEDSTSRALDGAVFSDAAATSKQPAGLLNGVAGIAPTAGGGQAAMLGDLKALAGGIADAGLDANFLLFTNPRQAVSIGILANGPQPFEVISHPSIAAGTVIAVHPGGIATGFGAEPDVEVSANAVLHYEDASPQQISTAGAVAAPVRSAFQSATHVLRVILDAAYVKRKAGAVQSVTGATW